MISLGDLYRCAYGGRQQCTAVTDLVGHNEVFAGFVDGSVLAGRISVEDDQKTLLSKDQAAHQFLRWQSRSKPGSSSPMAVDSTTVIVGTSCASLRVAISLTVMKIIAAKADSE